MRIHYVKGIGLYSSVGNTGIRMTPSSVSAGDERRWSVSDIVFIQQDGQVCTGRAWHICGSLSGPTHSRRRPQVAVPV